jgi:hypothetical protein
MLSPGHEEKSSTSCFRTLGRHLRVLALSLGRTISSLAAML